MGQRLDDYERRTRLAPALLAGLPVVALLVALGIRQQAVVTVLSGLIVTAGGPAVVSTVVRDRGKRLEGHLWERWGGPPTTRLLRTDGPGPGRRERRRSLVEQITGTPLPSTAHERSNPGHAQDLYEQAVAEVRAATRLRDRHPVVHAENVAYGFARNTLAIRPWGIFASSTALVGTVLATGVTRIAEMPYGLAEVLIAGTVAIVMLLFWWYFPTEDRVRTAADRYATQLLDAASTGR